MTGGTSSAAANSRRDLKSGAEENMSLAYLVSEYPGVSHTFILREVRGLRKLGVTITTTSINNPDRPSEKLTVQEREEAAATRYVKASRWNIVLGYHLAALTHRPLQYLRGLMFAFRLGGTDLKKLLYMFFYFVEAVMIGEWMEAAGLHHLHVHFATPASTVGLIAARIYTIGLSLTVHGPDEFYDAPGNCLTHKIAGSSFICCIGVFARSQLMKLSPPEHWSKFELAPLGIFLDDFTPCASKRTSERCEIVSIGRLVPSKGQHILLAAIHRLVCSGRNLCLRLVGAGPDRRSLEDEVRKRGLDRVVVFEGAVNPDHIRAIYESADIFVLASFAEGIPVVLMEAMAMEIPCVATLITGIPELIRDGIDGLLVGPSDDAALADAICRLMDNTELRHSLGKAGRERVAQHYNLETNLPRLKEIFRRRLTACA
jgi:colanic acid/amylovoran biosynthesis glycosyltransferase